MKRWLLVVLLAFASAAAAQSTDALVRDYTSLAGSESNARSLVAGLRDGTEVTMTSKDASGQTVTTRFDPPTKKMGNGNVNIALSLAQESLQQQGITKPTPEQLKTALNGVLQQRADGKGWGQIAQSYGVKLGEIMRSPKAEKPQVARAERPAKPERADKPERPMRPERPEKPERPGK